MGFVGILFKLLITALCVFRILFGANVEFATLQGYPLKLKECKNVKCAKDPLCVQSCEIRRAIHCDLTEYLEDGTDPVFDKFTKSGVPPSWRLTLYFFLIFWSGFVLIYTLGVWIGKIDHLRRWGLILSSITIFTLAQFFTEALFGKPKSTHPDMLFIYNFADVLGALIIFLHFYFLPSKVVVQSKKNN